MTATVPPESFRISAGGWWFLVHIADTVEAMREAMCEHVAWCHPEQLGCVVTIRGVAEYEFCRGFIFLPKDRLGAGLVAHELAHAAFRICEATGMHVEHWERSTDQLDTEPATDRSEEAYADIVELLTREFWANAYARGYAQAG